MNVPYRRLRERAAELGTSFQKYLVTLDRHLPGFLDRLEKHRVRERIDMWRPSSDPRMGFALVREIARTPEEEIRFGRTYYAAQYLLLDIVQIDALKLALASEEERFGAYHQFLNNLGKAFIRLACAYLEFLIRHFVPAARDLRWVILGVGTLRDQDDIDVVLVDDGSPARDAFTVQMGRVANEMLKSASPLHFYLAERMGLATFSHPVEDYIRLTDERLDDHVLQSEIVNSTVLVGDRQLAEAFRLQVVERYFHEHAPDPLYHEAFVRGMVGDIRSLLFHQLADDHIHPKNHGLRIIKGLAHVFRTMHGVPTRDPWKILEEVATMTPRHRHHLRRLKRGLSFFETVQTLYQVLHVQDEEIPVDASGQALDRVAQAMGYRPLGALTPHAQLLVEYYEQVRVTHEVARVLVVEIRRHLRKIGPVHDLIDGREPGVRNRALALVRHFERCPGNRYWYDVIERLDEPGFPFLRAMAQDFWREGDDQTRAAPEALPLVEGGGFGWGSGHGLTAPGREALIERFVEWGRGNVFAWLHLNRVLEACGTNDARRMRLTLNLAFLGAGATSDLQTRLANLFLQVPDLLHEYMNLLSPAEMDAFKGLLQRRAVASERVARVVRGISAISDFYHGTSRFFGRTYRAVAAAHPEYLDRLYDPEFLRQIGQGLIGQVTNAHGVQRKQQHLEQFFRTEYLRCGLLLLQQAPLDLIHREYTEFSDLYFTTLYRVARRAAEEETGQRIETRDRTAIFTTGGRGREEAFDDDLDMIVVADRLSDDGIAFLQRIVAKMNQQIVKLGTFPHYRMADYFGTFVTPLPVLEQHLRRDDPDLYLDMAEFLELRMVEGNSRTEDRIRLLLIETILFGERRPYLLGALGRELTQRREHFGALARAHPEIQNLKEHPGGLREIELALLVYKVWARLTLPVNLELFDHLSSTVGSAAAAFTELKEHFTFQKRLRHLIRVLVAADDTLIPETADLLSPWVGTTSGDALRNEVRERMARAAELVDGLVRRATRDA